MASSSVSQEDFDAEYELSTRRTRVRIPRNRGTISAANRQVEMSSGDYEPDGFVGAGEVSGCGPSGLSSRPGAAAEGSNLGLGGGGIDHDTSPKPTSRVKDKRTRPNHINKGKQQRDRRKLREKRRSTGVVHIPSTESTGGSTAEDEDELLSLTAETKKNTMYNEGVERDKNDNPSAEERLSKSFNRRNKSPSDLDADDEDNQDYDSTVNQSDSTMSLHQETSASRCRTTNGRPDTPDTESLEEINASNISKYGRTSIQLLERAREENKILLELLAEKDRKIAILQDDITRLSKVLQTTDRENDKLKEENKTLLRAMSQLRVT